MPIDRSKYPPNWEQISEYIRFSRAAGKCEGTPKRPDCRAVHLQRHPETGSNVILTTAHMDQDRSNNNYHPADPNHPDNNLRALCQCCHLDWDRGFNQQRRRYGRAFNDHQTKLDL
jgi:hypothetical protein